MERLFIALELDSAVREKINEYVNQLKEAGCEGKWVSEVNYHVTLAFIGDSDQAQKIAEILKTIQESSFSFTMDGTLRFHQLLALKIESPALSSLAEKVREALINGDIPFDQKAFKAHITLARKFKGEIPCEFESEAEASRIVLYKSEFTDGKRIYTPLFVLPLEQFR